MVSASAHGLPQGRRRIYFLVFRTDLMDQHMLDAALSLLNDTKNQLPRGSLDDVLNATTTCIREAGSERRPSTKTNSVGHNLATERRDPKWIADHAAFRSSHSLPNASSPGGRPFSSSLDAAGRRTLGLSLRCIDICDIVKLFHPDRDTATTSDRLACDGARHSVN